MQWRQHGARVYGFGGETYSHQQLPCRHGTDERRGLLGCDRESISLQARARPPRVRGEAAEREAAQRGNAESVGGVAAYLRPAFDASPEEDYISDRSRAMFFHSYAWQIEPKRQANQRRYGDT